MSSFRARKKVIIWLRRARVESTRAQLEEAIYAEATLKEMLRELRIKLQKNQ